MENQQSDHQCHQHRQHCHNHDHPVQFEQITQIRSDQDLSRSYVVAIICPVRETLEAMCARLGKPDLTFEEACLDRWQCFGQYLLKKILEKSFMHSRRLFYLLSLQRCDWCSVERSCQPWKTDAAWKVWGGHSNFNPSILTEMIHWCQILGWESLIGFRGRFLGRCVSPARSGGQRAALSPLPWSSRDDHCRSTMVMMVMTITSPQPWS